MKNRSLILNDLIKMQEQNNSLEEMKIKLQEYHVSYYEALNLLKEVTKQRLEELQDNLLKDEYWKNIKTKSEEKENDLTNEFEAIINIKSKKQKQFEEDIQECYECLVNIKKAKEKKLKNLDNTLNELFRNS